jgi:hypothetical protein
VSSIIHNIGHGTREDDILFDAPHRTSPPEAVVGRALARRCVVSATGGTIEAVSIID